MHHTGLSDEPLFFVTRLAPDSDLDFDPDFDPEDDYDVDYGNDDSDPSDPLNPVNASLYFLLREEEGDLF